MVRWPARDFGWPRTPYRSARWRTRISPRFRSNIIPGQATQLAGPQPGQSCRYQQRTGTGRGGFEDAADFVRAGNINTYFKSGLAFVGADTHPDGDVLGNVAAALRLREDSLQGGQNLAGHHSRHGPTESVPKRTHTRGRQFGQPVIAEMVINVGAQLPVLLQSGPLELFKLASLKPIGNGLGDSRTAARRRVGAGAHRRSHLGVIRLGVAFAFEAGDMPAVAIDIVNDPCRAGVPALGFPRAPANAHFRPCGGREFSSLERGRVTFIRATMSSELPATTSRS
jgi:hypothetical protein